MYNVHTVCVCVCVCFSLCFSPLTWTVAASVVVSSLAGLAALTPPLTIVRRGSDNDGDDPDTVLPTVMTCANYIKLPKYTTAEILKTKILKVSRRLPLATPRCRTWVEVGADCVVWAWFLTRVWNCLLRRRSLKARAASTCLDGCVYVILIKNTFLMHFRPHGHARTHARASDLNAHQAAGLTSGLDQERMTNE